MTEKIIETELWSELLKTKALEKSPAIVLYGMGDGADKVISVLEKLGIRYADTFASDEFVRGQSFHGKTVLTFSQIREKYDDFIILSTFAVRDEKTINKMLELSKNHKFFSPTVPIVGEELFTLDFLKKHDEEFDFAYNLLEDERSKEVFVDILNFKISGKIEYLAKATDEKVVVYQDILKLSESESIVDLGAYDGDTIREFLSFTNGKYSSIVAFEPDSKNFKKLLAKTNELKNITYFNVGAWDKNETQFFERKGGRMSRADENGIAVRFDSVDNLVSSPVSFLKMDIEGAELKALEGARKTIRTHKPKLYVCAYHRNEDFFVLPKKIKELNPDYKIFLRKSPYIPSWESNFYCVL